MSHVANRYTIEPGADLRGAGLHHEDLTKVSLL